MKKVLTNAQIFLKEKFAHEGKIVHLGNEVLIPLVKKNLTIYTKGSSQFLQDFAKTSNTSLKPYLPLKHSNLDDR